jgi:benzoylformate decarboxylase
VKWAGEPLRPEDAPALGPKALMLAKTAPAGPVYLSVPLDDWRKPADAHAVEQLLARSISGHPVAPESALAPLVDAVDQARSPVMVLVPSVDTEEAFPAAIALAEKAQLPVWIAPSPARWPFPTRHPNYQGELPSGAGALADVLAGHDAVVCFGAPIFRYHDPSDGDFLASGTVLFGVTDDPDEAARAPFGHLIVGDPTDALTRVSEKVAKTQRQAPRPRTLAAADTTGPHYNAEAILDAFDRGKNDDAIIALEWTSSDPVRHRLNITRAKSLYIPAAGGLGWGLPAAIGVQLAEPDRPVLGVIGDGAMQYTTSGLWTAARHNIPVTFVICTNTKYRALEKFSELLHVPDADYLDIPQIHILKAAEAYGIPATRVDTLDELSDFVAHSSDATGPRLVEILEK